MANIKFSYATIDHNPNMDDSSMDHWRCRLRNDGKSMTVYFSKGSGHNGAAPTLDEVLETLASDSAGVDNARDFEDWCSEYGYDTDSRKAERTYKAIEKQAIALRNLLGDDYDSIVYPSA